MEIFALGVHLLSRQMRESIRWVLELWEHLEDFPNKDYTQLNHM